MIKTKALIHVSTDDRLPVGESVYGELLESYYGNIYWMKVDVPGTALTRKVLVKIFKSPTNLKTEYKCNLCDLKYATQSNLRRHFNQKHGTNNNEGPAFIRNVQR